MLSVYTDAIRASQTGDTQYILGKSLDVFRVSGSKEACKQLEEGCEILGSFRNGIGYESYKVTSKEDIECIKNFFEEEFRTSLAYTHTVCFSFQEFFDSNCKMYDSNLYVTFFHPNEKSGFRYTNLRFENEKTKRIKDFVKTLNIKQDKETLIQALKGYCKSPLKQRINEMTIL